MKLIDNVEHSWKMLTVWVAGAWASIVGAYVADPGFIVGAWHMIPDELRPEMPHWTKGVLFGVTMFLTIYGARILRQKNLPQTDLEKVP